MNANLAIGLAHNCLNNKYEYTNNSHDSIISSLKFICKISKNEKIDTNKLTFHDSTSWTTCFVRTFTIQNRVKTLNFVQHIIERCFEIIESHLKSEDEGKIKLGKYILKDLNDCQDALRNLQYTYENDKMFVCRIESFIQKIQIKISDYEDTKF